MNARKTVTALLLLFVAVSIGFLVTRELTGGKTSDELVTSDPGSVEQAELIAYYFHGTRRCPTCKSLEAYTKEALESGFQDDLESGRIELRIVNIDEPANEHFVHDFALDARAIVIARLGNGQPEKWKRLDRMWELVSNKDEFVQYVQSETQAMLTSN
jgi:hypothetical protein